MRPSLISLPLPVPLPNYDQLFGQGHGQVRKESPSHRLFSKFDEPTQKWYKLGMPNIWLILVAARFQYKTHSHWINYGIP